MFFHISLPLLLTGAVNVMPASTTDKDRRQIQIETGYTEYLQCTDQQKATLNQAMQDARTIAEAGLEIYHDELSTENIPQYNKLIIEFNKQPAIDYFGPESKNGAYQQHIVDALGKASEAYPGWGWSDWWSNRYVALSCYDEINECSKGAPFPAYILNENKKYNYPLVVFCPAFFDKLKSHGEQVANVNANKDLQQNVANLRSQATTFLHELLHINWGTAQECGTQGKACEDIPQTLKDGEHVLSYKAGRAKLLAKRDASNSAWNNDGYAYYATSMWMKKKWGKYPKYPSAWDPSKSSAENMEREKGEPGYPAFAADFDLEDTDGVTSDVVVEDSVYAADEYPEWYQPVVTASFEEPNPSVQEPEDTRELHAPKIADVVCETSDGSSLIEDCVHAFGALKMFPTNEALRGKNGGTYWEGYVNSCAIAIYYNQGDWSDDCHATLRDVDDHAMQIFEKCQNPGNSKVGGKVNFVIDNCPAQIEIINTSQQKPPNGGWEK